MVRNTLLSESKREKKKIRETTGEGENKMPKDGYGVAGAAGRALMKIDSPHRCLNRQESPIARAINNSRVASTPLAANKNTGGICCCQLILKGRHPQVQTVAARDETCKKVDKAGQDKSRRKWEVHVSSNSKHRHETRETR